MQGLAVVVVVILASLLIGRMIVPSYDKNVKRKNRK